MSTITSNTTITDVTVDLMQMQLLKQPQEHEEEEAKR